MDQILKDLKKYSDPTKADHRRRFFKTEKGQYAAGDVFWGLTVPNIRQIAKKHKDIHLSDVSNMLDHKIHEVRLAALIILVHRFEKGINTTKIYNLYLKKAKQGRINNWDLVDGSAHQIVGGYLLERGRGVLINLAKSNDLWLQRISIITTYKFIRQNDFKDTLIISKILLDHDHDLIHKAVGWMIREVGNRDRGVEENFLKVHYQSMPRTMLRYAIEKFPEDLRQKYLKGKI